MMSKLINKYIDCENSQSLSMPDVSSHQYSLTHIRNVTEPSELNSIWTS